MEIVCQSVVIAHTGLRARNRVSPSVLPPFYVEALDGGESGGIQCGVAPRAGSVDAWVMIAVAVIVSHGYCSGVCKQLYQSQSKNQVRIA